MGNFITKLTAIFSMVLNSFKTLFETIVTKFKHFSIIFKFLHFGFLLYIVDLLLSPVLSHLVVIRNTITFFLTNSGMIGPITIQFFYLAIGTFIFFLLSRSVIRFFT